MPILTQSPLNPSLATANAAMGKYRWTICGLVFFATMINYLDRVVISLLKPYLETEFHWNSGDYANIEIAFKLAYAVGMVGAGRIIDKLGTKLGYAISTALWSVAAMGHALVSSTFGFGIARGFLGITEAGNFPAAIKTTAEWFPQRARERESSIRAPTWGHRGSAHGAAHCRNHWLEIGLHYYGCAGLYLVGALASVLRNARLACPLVESGG